MEKEWSTLSKEEKREKRLQDYISVKGINFRDAKAEKLYKERATRMLKAHRHEEPDRVPVSLLTGNYPTYYAGMNLKTIM